MGRKKKSDNSVTSEQPDNLIAFTYDKEMAQSIASDLLSENDLEGALSIYLEIEKGEHDFALYRQIADLYTDLGMYRYAINYWYKFLNEAPSAMRAEGYNGLGGNYYLLRNDKLAAYYFDLQISDKSDDDYPFDEMMYDLFDKDMAITLGKTEPEFTIYDAQKEADEKKLNHAKILINEDTEAARQIFNSIEKGSKYYGEAQFFYASLSVIEFDFDCAIQGYQNAISENHKEDMALTNLLAISLLSEKRDIFESTFSQLKDNGLIDFDTASKYFSIFAGLGKHREAYEFALKLSELLPYCGELHLYLAYAANNAKDYELSYNEFSKYYAITKADYIDIARITTDDEKNKRIPHKEMDYEPYMQKYSIIEIVKYFDEQVNKKPSEIRKNAQAIKQKILPYLSCENPEIIAAVFHLLGLINDTECISVMEEYLLNDWASDIIKPVVLTLLVEMGHEQSVGMVFNHIYSKVPFERVEFNDECGEVFRNAYALAFGRFVPYCEKEIYKLRRSAYDLYDKYLSSGNIRKIKNINTLAGLMLKHAELKVLRDDKGFYKYIGTTSTAVTNLEKLLGE